MGFIDTIDEKTGTDHVEQVNSNSASLDDLDTIETTQSGRYAWLVSITAAIGGMLFGYDTGIISAVLVYIGTSLDHKTLSANDKELITSITSGAAFFGAIFAGMTADKYGRKIAIYVGCVLFILGAVLQASAFSLAQMTVGRLVVGFGVGSAAMIVPMFVFPRWERFAPHYLTIITRYIAEVSPAKYRGRMIGLDNMSITGGQLISYGIGAGFAHVTGGWRFMVGGGAIPAIVLCCLLPFCPGMYMDTLTILDISALTLFYRISTPAGLSWQARAGQGCHSQDFSKRHRRASLPEGGAHHYSC